MDTICGSVGWDVAMSTCPGTQVQLTLTPIRTLMLRPAYLVWSCPFQFEEQTLSGAKYFSCRVELHEQDVNLDGERVQAKAITDHSWQR